MAKKRDNLKQFRKDIEAANKAFAQLSNEIIKLQKNGKSAAEINEKLGDAIEKVEKKFKATTGAIRVFQNKFSETTQKSKQATAEIKKLNSGFKSLDSSFKRATKTTDTFGQAFRKQFSAESLGKAAGNLLKYVGAFKLFNTVINLVKNTTVAAAKANIEFEAELAKLEAVTSANSEEMEMLSDNILQVAGNTKFTSSEIVQLQTALGKLGFSTQEIVAATQAVANVAQALGESAAPVAEKIGQILNQFNLTASESVMVGDVLVSTINNSALSFESFGTAIQYVGPLAAELGTSFVELSGAMAILADNGFTASRIGTGLRGVLTELGTSGRDLESIVRKLADEEISFAEAVELVGKRSAAQLITLVDNIDALEQAEDKYIETGAAIVASAKQIDTFRGNTELLNSAWNAFLIGLGEFYNRAGLVKAALRLLDSEAADTAEGLGLVADASPELIATGIEAAVNKFKELNGQGVEFEEIMIQARSATAQTIADEILKGDERMRSFLDRQIELNRQAEANKERFQYFGVDDALEAITEKIEKRREKFFNKVNAALADEVRQQVENAAIQTERNEITEEYSGIFDGLVDKSEKLKELADDQKLSEKERLDFNSKIEKEINQLKEKRAEIENGELKALQLKQSASIQLSEEESLKLKILEGQVEAYDTQIGKFRNLFVIAGEQKKETKGAEKNFNAQINALNLLIEKEKRSLANKLLQNKLQREALLNELENTTNKEKQEELQRKIVQLEGDSLLAQKSSFEAIKGFISDTRGELEKAQLSIKQTQIASDKIAKIEFKIGDLDIDIKELGKVAENLAESFEEQFGEELKEGKELTEAQTAFVQKFLDDLFNTFGDGITDEQKEILTDLVFSSLFADAEGVKKNTEKLAKTIKKNIRLVLDQLRDVFDEYNETYLENKKGRLEAELDSVKRASEIEQEILSAQLNNQLITEGQFRTKSLELRKVALAKENSINKKIFDAEKASDLRIVGAETAEALATNIQNNYKSFDGITATIVGAVSALSIIAAGVARADAINRRQFTPVRFEEGGMVQGPSHRQGGVPFTVQGRSGYEMEGGEFIVNKKASAMHRDLLTRINDSGRVNSSVGQYSFANGGIVPMSMGDESVNLLKSIAEATTTSALQSSKPVRAFVSSKDLRQNENERRLRDRNDRI